MYNIYNILLLPLRIVTLMKLHSCSCFEPLRLLVVVVNSSCYSSNQGRTQWEGEFRPGNSIDIICIFSIVFDDFNNYYFRKCLVT